VRRLGWGAGLGLAAILAVPGLPQPSTEPAAASTGDDVLARLTARAALYRSSVLRFACTELLFEEKVEATSGAPRSARDTTYRYLLQTEPDRPEVSEYREMLAQDGVPVRPSPEVIQTFSPPPYLWATLFDGSRQNLFRFEVVGAERRGVTDTLIVSFSGLLGFEDGRRLAEWSGRMWVDRDHLNPIHVEAEPARQVAALAMQLEEYRKAFRIGGLRLKARPRAYGIRVDFLVARHGLTFPSQAVWRQDVLSDRGDRSTVRLVRQEFSDYRFFDIRTEETMDGEVEPEPQP